MYLDVSGRGESKWKREKEEIEDRRKKGTYFTKTTLAY